MNQLADRLVATLVLAGLAPLLGLIALLIRLDSPRPVLYTPPVFGAGLWAWLASGSNVKARKPSDPNLLP